MRMNEIDRNEIDDEIGRNKSIYKIYIFIHY